jgi:F0F1-type ATP synthase gamma subunit
MGFKTNSFEDDKLAWNMSDQWLKDIAQICFKITEARQNDNVMQWYVLQSDLVDRMSFEFKEGQVLEVDSLMAEVEKRLNKPNTPDGLQLLKGDTPIIRKHLSKAYRVFLRHLNEYERIFSHLKKANWQDEVRSDFK